MSVCETHDGKSCFSIKNIGTVALKCLKGHIEALVRFSEDLAIRTLNPTVCKCQQQEHINTFSEDQSKNKVKLESRK